MASKSQVTARSPFFEVTHGTDRHRLRPPPIRTSVGERYLELFDDNRFAGIPIEPRRIGETVAAQEIDGD